MGHSSGWLCNTSRNINQKKLKHWCQLLLNHIYFINSLWPTYAIWRHISGSTLAQVIAKCLKAPSHYLNQCWLLINKVLWHSPESNSTAKVQATIVHNELESYYLKITVKSPRGHCVITVYTENKTSCLHSWKNQYHGICSCPWQYLRVHYM